MLGLVRFTQFRAHTKANLSHAPWCQSCRDWLVGFVLWYRQLSRPQPRIIWHHHFGSIPADTFGPYFVASTGSPMHSLEKTTAAEAAHTAIGAIPC